MATIENNNTYNVGDKVWWFDAYGTMRNGNIYEIRPEEGHNKVPVALIYENGKPGLQTGAMLEDCWPSEQACIEAEQMRAEAQKAEYKESIKDVNDLVKFMFEHDVVSEYKDYDALAAAKERANELLGLDIDNAAEDDFTQAVGSIPQEQSTNIEQ